MHTKNTQKFLVMIAAIAVAFMVFAVVMMASVPTAQAAGKQCAHAHDARTLAQNRAAVYCIINAERAVEGVQPYSTDSRSELAAQRHSADMAKRKYFDHTAPAPAPYGRSISERMISAGWPAEIYDTNVVGWPDYEEPWKYIYDMNEVGEVITTSISPWDAISNWLNSPGHCRAIMDPNGDLVGVGVKENYWTFNRLDLWNIFVTGVERSMPKCPRKPRTNHPPTLRVVKVVRRGTQLMVRIKTNVSQKVRVVVRQRKVRKFMRKLNGKPKVLRFRTQKRSGSVAIHYKSANGRDYTFTMFR